MNWQRRQRKSDKKPEVIPTFTVPCPICAEGVTVTIHVKQVYAWCLNGTMDLNIGIEPRYSHTCAAIENAA